MLFDLFKATILGIVEGLTEFVPVSSTGHLLLMEHFFGFDDDAFGKSFVVLIQLGAILALLSIYFMRLWKIALALPTDPRARHFVIGVLIAFLPAAIIGALAYSIIKSVLFNVWIVCIMFILGGIVLLVIDRLDLKPRYPRRHQVLAADVSRHRPDPVHIDDSRRIALGRDHRRRDAARRRSPRVGGIFVLPRDADHGRGLRLRGLQEPRRALGRQHAASLPSALSPRSSPVGSL